MSNTRVSHHRSLDASSDQQNLDLKRQLQVIEQEASVLRAKTQSLESDNEKLQAENKKLQVCYGYITEYLIIFNLYNNNFDDVFFYYWLS